MGKRRYTISERVLAANRRNLDLARRVEPERRFRTTPRRRAASQANLEKARAVLHEARLSPDGYPRTVASGPSASSGQAMGQVASEEQRLIEKTEAQSDFSPRATGRSARAADLSLPHATCHIPLAAQRWPDSPAYGTRLDRGLYAVSLRRSARLVGESAEAFDRHVDRFLQALEPRSATETRLARGLAEIVWRRLRFVRSLARTEEARLVRLLREAAALGNGVRDLGFGVWGPEHAAEFSNPKTRPVPTGYREIPNPGFMANPGLAANPETRAPNPGPVANPVSRTPLPFGLGLEVERIFDIDNRLMDQAESLNVRLERLAQRWVELRGGDPMDLLGIVMPRASDRHWLDCSPAAMGNPFVCPSAVDGRLQDPGEPSADGPRPPLPKLSRRRPRAQQDDEAGVGGFPIPRRDGAGFGFRNASGESYDAGPGEVVLDSPEALRELLEQAMRGVAWASCPCPDAFETEGGSQQQPTTNNEQFQAMTGVAWASCPCPGAFETEGGSQQQPTTNNEQFLVSALWSRLTHFRDLAAREEQELDHLLEDKLEGRVDAERWARVLGWASMPPADAQALVLLTRLTRMLNQHAEQTAWRAALKLNQELAAALREHLSERFGSGELLDSLQHGPALAAEIGEREHFRQELDRRLADYQAELAQPISPEESRMIETARRATEQTKAALERVPLPDTRDPFWQNLIRPEDSIPIWGWGLAVG